MQLRDLRPWRTFCIGTSWSPEVAVIQLKKSVDQRTLLVGNTGSAPFVGDVLGTSAFQFTRRIGYNNAFLPIIRVIVEPWHRGGARLRVTMRLHAFITVFTAVWMTGATAGALACSYGVLVGHPAGLAALALPLFGVCLVGLSFGLEARKAENLLRSIYADAPALPAATETGQAYR